MTKKPFLADKKKRPNISAEAPSIKKGARRFISLSVRVELIPLQNLKQLVQF